MRIVVCVKRVPDINSDRRIEGGRVVRGPEDVLNELDENAVEAAVSLAEQVGGTVTALTMGPPAAVDALRRALQMGADDAVLVSDERLAGSDVVATARVLGAAITRLGDVDAVVTGMATMDGLTSMLPDALAAVLSLPALTLAASVECDGRTLRVTRTLGDAVETWATDLPALLSVTDQANQPRIPNFRTMTAARRKPVATWGLDDLGLDAVDLRPAVALLDARRRPLRREGVIVTDTGDGGRRLAAWLAEKGVV
ncbi:MAG: electron transfer flavoprotein subunit beta/FixA family protein [Actinomycetales bacterium]|nr:electron transfer flavoprotein subunit beta/FixA family protein [Actinomycetales bacterium]